MSGVQASTTDGDLDIISHTHNAVPTLHTADCPSATGAQSLFDIAASVDSSPTGRIATRTIASRRPTLPTAPTSTLSLNTTLELPTLPASSTTLTLLQARGPKRDTFDPSHRVRKRRSGFLARIRSRNGRNLVKRRRLKKRSTLSH
ncbi:unnamed protein product [Aureobasidium pullulans]|nr:unnamed protein product [Aureobasidium pullulans]